MNDKFPQDPASIKHASKLNWSGTRRTFIRNTSLMAAGTVAGALAPKGYASSESKESAIRKTPSYNPDMEYRRLGKTGLWVSAVCLGGHWKELVPSIVGG